MIIMIITGAKVLSVQLSVHCLHIQWTYSYMQPDSFASCVTGNVVVYITIRALKTMFDYKMTRKRDKQDLCRLMWTDLHQHNDKIVTDAHHMVL
jgi:hypothetical protein